MLKAIIIEDEKAAQENLVQLLHSVSDEIRILARLTSVRESIDYLSKAPEMDLIFSDVQLGDGLSFEIFNQTGARFPVIFITGYDEFMLTAFECNGIDYLLKPVDIESLKKALNKYHMLERHFVSEHSIRSLLAYMGNQKKKRIIVKKGTENISLKLEDVVLFYTENKIVYVIDRSGKKYLADKNLSLLEQELDNSVYFRANRQYIININYVRGFKSFEKVKLQVDLTMPDLNHSIIVSQEMAPVFREWMLNA